MDPLSLSASIVALADTGLSVGKFLVETWSSYKNAPDDVLEIAHEVNICCSLMTPLGERLKTGSVKYNPEFQTSVQWLVTNSEKTFKGIEKLIPKDGNLDRGILPKWNFVLKRTKVLEHRKRLKQIQQMFVFMKEMILEVQPPASSSQVPGASITALPSRPVTLTGSGFDGNGARITYEATLSVLPIQPSANCTPQGFYDDSATKKEKACEKTILQERRRPKTRSELSALRRNPFFAKDLLKPPAVQAMAKKQQTTDRLFREAESATGQNLTVPSEDQATKDVDEFAARWFGDVSPPKTPTFAADDYPPSPSYFPPRFPNESPPKSPLGPASIRFTPPKSPRSPHSPNPTSYYTSSPLGGSSFNCDSCRKEIRGLRYECRSCDDFDMCKRCFDDPNVTIRLRHRHPKSHFKEV